MAIYKYRFKDKFIVLDINESLVYDVDEMTFDILDYYGKKTDEETSDILSEKYDRDEISEAIEEIRELEEEGLLFTPEKRVDRKLYEKGIVKAMCLHVSHDCNLACRYCFASGGNFNLKKEVMSEETARKAIDFIIANSGNKVHLEVDFFGGEPLMNFDVVKELVAYARSIEKDAGKNFRFTLTTNGMNVNDEVIEFANRECHNVVLSLDGRREIHDASRSDWRGVGSYDRIVPKFQKFVKARGDAGYYMRGTFTHKNPDFTKDLFHMADLGFTQLSMEPVVSPAGTLYALTEEDLPIILEQYEILAKEMLKREAEGRPITFYHYMLDLNHGPCIYKRIAGCGSGTEYFAVTPTGDLYPCHQFVGDERYKMGNVWDGVTNTGLRDEFKLCNVYARPECDDCWAKLYCSGGCAANAYHATGSIRGVYDYGCKLFRKRIECAIMMKAAEAEMGMDPDNGEFCAGDCEECLES